jgi:methylphosphotriester-DNA--protein-cysteine methyltransferase
MPHYREQPARAELREFVRAVWSLDSAGRTTEAVLPDGCIDIVWRAGFGLVCAGPDTGPVTVQRPAAATVIGVRFRPGAAPAMLGVPADALRDLRTPLADLWGPAADRLEERIAAAPTTRARHEILQAHLVNRLPTVERPDRVVTGAVAMLNANGLRHVNGLGDAIGISERQLRRRFHATVGYGPKTLARILRLQRMLALASRGELARVGLAGIALAAGYADQAHMTAECTRLAGKPPARLIASRAAAVRFLKEMPLAVA